MNHKLSQTKHSMKMMWGCAAIVVLVVIAAVATSAYVLLFIAGCIVMFGAMMWMMRGGMGGMGDMGGGTRGGGQR